MEPSTITKTSQNTATDASNDADQTVLASGACDDLDSVQCKVMLPSTGGTNNCFVGNQVCVNGEWTACLSDEDSVALLADLSSD
jgi:hypothetical protein